MIFLNETLKPQQSSLLVEASEEKGKKKLHLQGVFIQGDVKNHNQRVYPKHEILRAVDNINERLKDEDVLGECDHPQELTVGLDRVSHKITKMWMEGSDGLGKLQIIPTTLGNLVTTLIEAEVRLGVSSRGSGNVDHRGYVSDFEIVTVDIVAKPSAPNAYPQAVYEAFNGRRGAVIEDLARAVANDPKAQKYLVTEALNWVNNLK